MPQSALKAKRNKQPDKRTVAYHEAGHAILALYFNTANDSDLIVVNDKPTSREGGSTEHFGISRFESGIPERKKFARDLIVMTLAGYESAAAASRRDLCRKPGGGDVSDRFDAMVLLQDCPPRGYKRMGDAKCDRKMDRLRAEARRLVKRLWPKIQSAGLTLLAKGSMTFSELRGLTGIKRP
jgi:hypothetical protein